MSNTPLVKTRGRSSAATRAARSSRAASLAAKAGAAALINRASIDVLEHLDHALDAAGRARDVGRGVPLVGAHHTEQVHDAALGHDLDMVDLKLVGFDEPGFDLRRNQGVVAAR